MTALLEVQGLQKSFGGLQAANNLNFDLRAGELHAVIGPNGAGKSTFIHQLAGEMRPDAGRIWFEEQDITYLPAHARALKGIGRSYQITSVIPEFSALQNAMLAVQAQSGHSFGFWTPVSSDAKLIEPARRALRLMGLESVEHERAASLAYGTRRQLDIAMALAMQPKVLLLDEPMTGMSRHESTATVGLLSNIKGSCGIVMIEHDMDAVFELADRITVLVYGKVIACGTPEEIRADSGVRTAYLGEEED